MVEENSPLLSVYILCHLFLYGLIHNCSAMSLNPKECDANKYSTDQTENQDVPWYINFHGRKSPRQVVGLTLSHAETQQISSDGEHTPHSVLYQDATPHSNSDFGLGSSKHCNEVGIERNSSIPSHDSSWPNVAEGQKIRVLKNSTSNETFAQKLQVGITWKSILNQSAKLPNAEKGITTSEHPPSLISINDNLTNRSKSCQLNLGNKVKSKEPTTSKLPPHDSGVHLIDGSLKEKWTQSDTAPNSPIISKTPPLLEKDFPDLSDALQFLSKCSIKHENFESTESQEIKDKKIKSKRKSRSNQPCRKDPISVNIVDFLKETCQTSKRSTLTDHRLKFRDLEKRKICGNILDSSNPIRKRGKFREKPPKKRLSKLKQVIMNERHKKKEQKNINMCTSKSLNCLNECSELLVGTMCCEFNSLHIMSENNDEELISAVPQEEELNQEKQEEVDKLDGKTFKRHDDIEVIHSPSPLHSRKFRSYCNNIRCQELDEAVTNLLKEIYRFQDRHHKKDPIKAHAKRRFILGIREVKKFLMLKKLKTIIIAPDLEPVEGPGGLDETIIEIREEGRTQQVPVIFAVGRRQLGYTLRKKVPISVIGIINAEGAEELFHLMLNEWHDAVLKYQEKLMIFS